MKATTPLLLAVFLMPLAGVAQQDPRARLLEVLPGHIAADVMSHVGAAHAQRLPSGALVNVALEGITKGRSGEEVLAAVELLVGDLSRARDALDASGRAPATVSSKLRRLPCAWVSMGRPSAPSLDPSRPADRWPSRSR